MIYRILVAIYICVGLAVGWSAWSVYDFFSGGEPSFSLADLFAEYDYRLSNAVSSGANLDALASDTKRIDIYLIEKSGSVWNSLDELHDDETLLRSLQNPAAIRRVLGLLAGFTDSVEPDGRHAALLNIVLFRHRGRPARFAVRVASPGRAYVMPDAFPNEFGSHGSNNSDVYAWLQAQGLLPWDRRPEAEPGA